MKNLIYNHVVPFRSLSAPLGSIALLQKIQLELRDMELSTFNRALVQQKRVKIGSRRQTGELNLSQNLLQTCELWLAAFPNAAAASLQCS